MVMDRSICHSLWVQSSIGHLIHALYPPQPADPIHHQQPCRIPCVQNPDVSTVRTSLPSRLLVYPSEWWWCPSHRKVGVSSVVRERKRNQLVHHHRPSGLLPIYMFLIWHKQALLICCLTLMREATFLQSFRNDWCQSDSLVIYRVDLCLVNTELGGMSYVQP